MYMYLYLLGGFLMAERFPALIYKAFHPSLWFGLHALGGICYTAFFHCPCNPCSLILEDLHSEPRMLCLHGETPIMSEDLYSEPRMLCLHGETPIMSLFMSRSFPFCTISLETSIFPN